MEQKTLQEITLIDRTGTNSTKWDDLRASFGEDSLLPVWVADMDFKTPLCVRQALHEAVDHGAFGYYKIPETYHQSILNWEETRHGSHWKEPWLRTTSGVVSGLFHLLSAITQPGDAVLLQTPVYYPFYRVIAHTDRRAVYSPLHQENGVYTPDLEDLEQKIMQENVKVFLLCSPHNPVGRVWTEEELRAMLGICRRHGVQVISDEIHHDILMPGYQHISAASLWSGPNPPITFFSASKTFNLAGMKNSILAIPQKETRAKFDAFERSLGTGSSSTLDYIAVTAAFRGGAEWLDTVLAQIFDNYQMVKETLAPFPQITISPLEGTYLLWLDLGNVVPREQLHAFVQTECGLAPDYGHWFFPEGVREDTHIRINLAAPQATIQKAAKQLAEGIRKELADA